LNLSFHNGKKISEKGSDLNILFLSHRIPYPPDKGDKIRSFNEIVHLARKHNIFLGTTLDVEQDRDLLKELDRYCHDIFAVHFNRQTKLVSRLFRSEPFSVKSFYDDELQRYVDKTLANQRIDTIFCFCSSMAEYVFKSKAYRENGLRNVKIIMDYVDLDSDKWLQYSKYANFPLDRIYKIENKRLFQYEQKINMCFDHSIFVSEREEAVFRRLFPGLRNVSVIPNGVDYEYFRAEMEADLESPEIIEGGPVLLFTGIMNYFANEDGVKWFCESIFPIIRKAIPDIRFFIVGNHPTNIVWNLAEIDGVTVTGYVDDIRPFYWMADVCVIPLRIARGLQNKVLEAMATGNTVVATSNASDGIICENGKDLIIADDENRFADAVIELVRNESKRWEIGANAMRNVRVNYDWDKNLKALNQIIEQRD
jgi:sugar transferase (PEP-CTERM/EpsH1 system associated)